MATTFHSDIFRLTLRSLLSLLATARFNSSMVASDTRDSIILCHLVHLALLSCRNLKVINFAIAETRFVAFSDREKKR
jgi:hypothetical protein